MNNQYGLTVWTRPECYGGFNPEGDFFLYSQHRDSDAIERSNFEVIINDFKELNKKYEDRCEVNPDLESGEERYAYVFRAHHWGFGWVEYFMLRQDAPEEFQKMAYDIMCALANYPVLDEMHLSDLEYEEAQKWWDHAGYRERLDAFKHERPTGESFFSVRQESVPCWAVDFHRNW